MQNTTPEIRRKLAAVRRARPARNKQARQEITVIGLRTDAQAMAALKTLIITDKGTLLSKAEKAGVCPSTIAKIRDGVTKKPRFSTLLGIVEAYGFHVQLTDETNKR